MINDHRSLSSKGFQLLQQLEGCKLLPYDDQTGGRITAWIRGATIGYGHLIPIEDWKNFKWGIEKAQAIDLLRQDLKRFEAAVRQAINVSLNQHQFDALVILAFNIGVGAFKSSSVVKLINDPQYVTAYASLESAWKAWKRSQGVVMVGLVCRRSTEWNLWKNAIYEEN
ncbi:MAG: lysozyme [Thiomicrospira sp.]|jgi:GH24 family phage-related lysozyme (muramidase)